MTNLEKYNTLKETAEKKGLTLNFAGYTKSKRGNESIYSVKSEGLQLKKGTLPQIKRFLNNVN